MEQGDSLFSRTQVASASAATGAPHGSGAEDVTQITEAEVAEPEGAPPASAASDGEPAWGDLPYEFDRCVVDLRIIMLPDDGNAAGRDIIVSATTHADDPLIAAVHESDLGALPAPVAALLDQLKQALAERGRAAAERHRRAEDEKQRAAERRNLNNKPRAAATPARPQPPGPAAPVAPTPPPAQAGVTAAQPRQFGLFG